MEEQGEEDDNRFRLLSISTARTTIIHFRHGMSSGDLIDDGIKSSGREFTELKFK